MFTREYIITKLFMSEENYIFTHEDALTKLFTSEDTFNKLHEYNGSNTRLIFE